jgi:hypothetical protein
MNNIQIEKLHPEIAKKSILSIYTEALKKHGPYENHESVTTVCYETFAKLIFARYQCNVEMDIVREMALNYLMDPIMFEVSFILHHVLSRKNPNNFVIQKDFFSKFTNIKIKNVKISHLPKAISGYIKLPIPIVDDDGSKYPHAYVFCGKDRDFFPEWVSDTLAKQWRSGTNNDRSDFLLEIALLADPPFGTNLVTEGEIRSFGMRFPKDENILIDEFLAETPDTVITLPFLPQAQRIQEYPTYLRIVLNLLLYINSGAPDIRDFRNTAKYPGQKRKPLRHSDTLSTLDCIKLIGYDWKKDVVKNYSAASWDVDGHFRWQKCGPELSQVKLIWIDPHPAFRHTEN